MNNLLSYFGLVQARISASENDLPVSSSGRDHFRSWYFHSSVNLHSSFISSVNLQSPATWSATSKYRARFDKVDTSDNSILIDSIYNQCTHSSCRQFIMHEECGGSMVYDFILEFK